MDDTVRWELSVPGVVLSPAPEEEEEESYGRDDRESHADANAGCRTA